MARYMSEEQKRKYGGVLADGKGVETVVGSGRGEEGKGGEEGKEGEEEEDAFEWIRRKNDEELAVPLYDDGKINPTKLLQSTIRLTADGASVESAAGGAFMAAT